MLPQDEYLESKVLTASPHQLHLFVVDAAIRHTTFAIEALKNNAFELLEEEAGHARNHVSELMGGLDEAAAPHLVAQLKALFTFCYRCIAEAEIHHQPEMMEDAITILRQHRETWIELIDLLAEQAAAQSESLQSESTPVPSPHFGHVSDNVDAGYETGSHEWTM